jgi:hypothetical protein
MCGFGKYLIQKIVLQRPLKKVSLLKEMLRIIKQIVIPEKNGTRCCLLDQQKIAQSLDYSIIEPMIRY